MTNLTLPFDTANLPRASQPDRAEIGIERLVDRYKNDEPRAAFVDSLVADADGRRLLDAIFGNSVFLGQCLLQDIGFLETLLAKGPDESFQETLDAIAPLKLAHEGQDALMASLRQARRRIALLTGIADIAGLWPLSRVTGSLSKFADIATDIATAHLLRSAAAQGALSLRHPEDPNRDSGYFVLGMGKLGANELNYSSDIDLIVLYDPDKVVTDDAMGLGQVFVRATRALVRILDERTTDGYVFRTDLRLRPDPSATPLAISVNAAAEYYESMGQNWERAAMIKARPIAGDLEAGARFLEELRPYIWRKHLDFAAIQDIHSIKRQITAHRGGGEIAINGHNIKLGRGGIREIEFFAQTQQLIWGGRNPSLRMPETCAALIGLATAGRATDEVASEMIAAYEFLRRVEHRLQMIDDKQTHSLPDDDAEIDRLAAFLGYADGDSFRDDLLLNLGRVERHYAALFEDSADLGGGGALVFTGGDDHPETVQNLEDMGFKDGRTVSGIIRAWHHGRYRATRSERSRQLLTEHTPGLLTALSRTAEPSAALLGFDTFLKGLPAGVQIFSLFAANPPLLELVAEIMGNAPRLSEWLRRNPSCLDAVLTDGFFEEAATREVLEEDLTRTLRQANDFQDILDYVRRWTNEHKFQVGVQSLRGLTDGTKAGPTLSAVAETAIALTWRAVEQEFVQQHGSVPGGGMALLALGKLGGREMTQRSDLDLVFVYDHDEDATGSDGPKSLVPGVYFTRLAQRLITAITAQTGEGHLYELDMRLRPSGNKGPIASRLDGFTQYHVEQSWTWEHMAMTRARVFAGPDTLRTAIEGVIGKTLTRDREPDELLADVASMRERMAKEHTGKSIWDVKHLRGGLVDIEFMAQYFMLRNAAERPSVLSPNTEAALRTLHEAGCIDDETADILIPALGLWQRLQSVLRLTCEGEFDDTLATVGQKNLLIRAGNAESFGDLRQTVERTAGEVHALFDRLITAPAAPIRAARDEDSNKETAR